MCEEHRGGLWQGSGRSTSLPCVEARGKGCSRSLGCTASCQSSTVQTHGTHSVERPDILVVSSTWTFELHWLEAHLATHPRIERVFAYQTGPVLVTVEGSPTGLEMSQLTARVAEGLSSYELTS